MFVTSCLFVIYYNYSINSWLFIVISKQYLSTIVFNGLIVLLLWAEIGPQVTIDWFESQRSSQFYSELNMYLSKI